MGNPNNKNFTKFLNGDTQTTRKKGSAYHGRKSPNTRFKRKKNPKMSYDAIKTIRSIELEGVSVTNSPQTEQPKDNEFENAKNKKKSQLLISLRVEIKKIFF